MRGARPITNGPMRRRLFNLLAGGIVKAGFFGEQWELLSDDGK